MNKSDWYLRFILTVIAMLLAVDLFYRTTPPVSASGPVPVTIEGVSGGSKYSDVLSVRIVSIDEAPSLAWEALPVKVKE